MCAGASEIAPPTGSMRSAGRVLVLGLGNPILTDDGVGVKVALMVERALPPDAEVGVREVSVGGLRLMEEMLGYDRVIIVDALQRGNRPPGTVTRMTLEDLRAVSPTQHSASAHDTSLVTAIDMAERLGMPVPSDVVIFGIEVENVTDFGDEPTPDVAAAIGPVAAAVLAELGFQQGIDDGEGPHLGHEATLG